MNFKFNKQTTEHTNILVYLYVNILTMAMLGLKRVGRKKSAREYSRMVPYSVCYQGVLRQGLYN
jgi:hypothetical protein